MCFVRSYPARDHDARLVLQCPVISFVVVLILEGCDFFFNEKQRKTAFVIDTRVRVRVRVRVKVKVKVRVKVRVRNRNRISR